MRQSEKLDAILNYLYERRDDDKQYSITDILSSVGIEFTVPEIARLAEHLEKDKYVTLNDLSSKLKKIKITSKGISYAEGDSYTKKGSSIVNNHYNIVNSPQANIIVNSSQVAITQNQYEKATEIVKQIREVMDSDSSISEHIRYEVIECLAEIETSLESKRKPKFAIKALLEIASNVSSISSLALSLAQILPGILPTL
jgi:hypothetical protein